MTEKAGGLNLILPKILGPGKKRGESGERSKKKRTEKNHIFHTVSDTKSINFG